MTGNAAENLSHIQFSIIIPTKNRARQLIGLIRQLRDQDYPKNAFEIIVVDNNSTDSPVPLLEKGRYANLRILSEFRRGPTFCRNWGFRHARYDHVIFLDDDISISRHFLLSCEQAWRDHPDAAAIGGRILTKIRNRDTRKHDLSLTYAPFFGVQDYGPSPSRLPNRSFLLSSVLSVRKKQSGGYDLFHTKLGRFYGPLLVYGEDFELSTRFLLENRIVVYTPTIRAYHKVKDARFSKRYIAARSLLSGIECYLEDRYLSRQFSSYQSETKSRQLLRHLFPPSPKTREDFFWPLHDPFVIAFLVGYFFLGPIVYLISHLDR